MIKNILLKMKWLPILVLGCAVFALGFDVFLAPHEINCGGLSGLAQVFVQWINLGTVGILTACMNVPLFIIGGKKIGTRFFIGSLVGMVSMSLFLDLFTVIPAPQTDIMLGTLYGGLTCGAGMGLVFLSGVSSGGTDIVVRLVKRKWPKFSIGRITLAMDLVVAVLTGIVFHDFAKTLYSGITLYITSIIVDAVIYSFDYSKVAMIISPRYKEISDVVVRKLDRGVTLLDGHGYYSGRETKVVLTAIKRHQVADLKAMASEIDPDAFIIIQEAHQVLGDGFGRYSKDSLQ